MPNKKKARQMDIPGTEDREIKELKDAALDYAEVRDERQQLTAKEVPLKQQLLSLMKKHKKENYKYGGVEIRVVHEKENVKVKVKKESDESEE